LIIAFYDLLDAPPDIGGPLIAPVFHVADSERRHMPSLQAMAL
jgi:hypothetical protein